MSGVKYKILILFLISTVLIGVLVSQDPAAPPPTLEDQFRDELRETFGAIAIMEVSKNNQELRIKTGLPVIGDEAYVLLVMEVCAILVTKPATTYEEIRFVNGIEKQGYVYKAPAECESVIAEPDKEAKKLIFAQTEFCRGRC